MRHGLAHIGYAAPERRFFALYTAWAILDEECDHSCERESALGPGGREHGAAEAEGEGGALCGEREEVKVKREAESLPLSR